MVDSAIRQLGSDAGKTATAPMARVGSGLLQLTS
jgi:hypothetical protein